jgi:hypothetical protein
MEEELRAVLLANAGVAALVPPANVNWGSHPQGLALPGIVLNTIGDAEGYTMTGPDGLSQGRVQVDCYGTSYGQAKELSRAVIAALSGYRGGGFQGVFRVGTRDGREGGTNEATRPSRVSLDFTTHWREQP